MLVVHASDLHIDYRRYGRVNPETGLNTAWESSHACWMASCQWAVDNAADAFIFGGDGFSNGRPTPEAAELVAEGFRLLSDHGIPSVIIRGNHELISVPASHRDINHRFADIPGVTVVDEARTVVLDSGLQIVGVPWPRRNQILADIPLEDFTPTEINSMVGNLLTDKIRELGDEVDPGRGPVLLAGHFTASNASLGTDRRGSEILVHAVFEEPIVPITALTEGPWQHVALGHIHKHQMLADGVYYVGSPNRVDFSEEDDPKGFHAIRMVEGSTGMGGELADVEFIPTPSRKMRTIRVEQGFPDDLEAGTLVKLVLPDGERVPSLEINAMLHDAGAILAKVDARPASIVRNAAAVLAVEVSELDGLKAWMDKNGVDEDSRFELVLAAQELLDADENMAFDLSEE